MKGPQIQLSAVALAAALAFGCSRGEEPAAPANSAASTPGLAAAAASPLASAGAASPSTADDELAGLAALVKLIAQEYALAVDGSGVVKNDTELAEAELFADQAKLKYQRLGAQVKASPEDRARAGASIDALVGAVAARRPATEVSERAREAAIALTAVGPAESAATAGLRAATAEADRAITAEKIAADYRVGVFAEPARRLYRAAADGSPAPVPTPADARTYLAVVLRERRSKRFLPDARLTAEVVARDGRVLARSELVPVWSDFPQYGGELPALDAAAATLRLHVEPPQHARHGDMLAHVAKPADAAFDLTVTDGRPTFAPLPPTPVDEDYAIGEDILQGFAESRAIVRSGEYQIGFIAEPPEPFWLWKDGPTLKPVQPEDTHHLEVVLQDRATGLLVPSATVSLTLTPKGGGEPIHASMHSLLSAFQHYGETLRVPPGEYRVQIDIAPPDVAVIDEPRFLPPAHAELDWRAEPAKPAAG